jgi:hypothetical protein
MTDVCQSDQHRYVHDVLTFFSKHDLTSDELLNWYVKDDKVVFFMTCSDTFMWGTADGEDIEDGDLELIEQCIEDLDKADQYSYCDYLGTYFAARKRGMRPMRLWLARLLTGNYRNPDPRTPEEIATWNAEYAESHARIHALYLATGPERDPRTEG